MNDHADGEADVDGQIASSLRRRAARGEMRRADQVWAELMTRNEGSSRSASRSRLVWLSAAAAVAAIVAGGSMATRLSLGSTADGTPPVAQPSSQTTAPTPPTPAPDASASPGPDVETLTKERSRTYIACVRARGIEIDYAEMRRNRRPPDWVKTLIDVPAEVHRPCFQEIGGRDPLASSLGSPVTLGECESIDRTPPIDWRPAPRQVFRGSGIATQDASVIQGSGTLSIVLRDGVRQVPENLLIECWNGQAWQPAYAVTELGGASAMSVELEAGVEPAAGLVEVSGSTLDVPVPVAAPTTDYRILDVARSCGQDGTCTSVPLEVSFSVTPS